MNKSDQQIDKHITDRFQLLIKIGSGAYGHVWKIKQKQTKKIYALKKIYSAFQNNTDSQRTYRQISILKKCQHPNIIKLHEIIKSINNIDIYLIFDYFQSDLFNAIRDDVLNNIHKKYILYQLAKSLKYLHSAGIIHRDIKPSNVLIDQNCLLKLCDFGLARTLFHYNSEEPVLTEFIATRWYRAPQVLFGSQKYGQQADMWSLGCLLYELYAGRPLLPGQDSLDQIQKLLEFKGKPTEQQKKQMKVHNIDLILENFKAIKKPQKQYYFLLPNKQITQIIQNLLQYNPKKRYTPDDILRHKFLQQFNQFESIPISNNYIKIYPNDNKKLTAQAYRNLIYKFFIKQNKNKHINPSCSRRNLLNNWKNSVSLHLGSFIDKSSKYKKNSSSFTINKSPYRQKSKKSIHKNNQKNSLKLQSNNKRSQKNIKVFLYSQPVSKFRGNKQNKQPIGNKKLKRRIVKNL